MSNNRSDLMYHVYEYGINPRSRTIWLDDEDIDSSSASRISKGIRLLSDNSSDPITLLINSPGGNVYDGFAVCNEIRRCPCQVIGEVTGQASSMASIILQSCGLRLMYPDSILYLHGIQGTQSGEDAVLKKETDEIFRLRRRLCEVYANRSNQNIKYFQRRIMNGWYLTAEQALELSLIDEVIRSPDVY